MKKKFIIPLIILVVTTVAVSVMLVTTSSDESSPTTVAEKNKNQPKTLATCSAENEQIKQEDEDPIPAAIAQEVVGQLIDVPAGTQVDVPIATLDDTNATGAAIYPKEYGTYNFVAKKDSTKPLGWKITSFVACKK